MRDKAADLCCIWWSWSNPKLMWKKSVKMFSHEKTLKLNFLAPRAEQYSIMLWGHQLVKGWKEDSEVEGMSSGCLCISESCVSAPSSSLPLVRTEEASWMKCLLENSTPSGVDWTSSNPPSDGNFIFHLERQQSPRMQLVSRKCTGEEELSAGVITVRFTIS